MSEPEQPCVLRIEGDMSIYRAAELKDILRAALDGATALEIDLSAVTECDTAGVQLLMLTKKMAQADRRELRLCAHSPAVLDALERLNLAAYFGDPIVMARQPSAGRATSGTSGGAQ